MQSSFGESYVGARERARLEYIPTEEEISRILNESGLNLKDFTIYPKREL